MSKSKKTKLTLSKAISDAIKSEGYFIAISRLNNRQLTHIYFTRDFGQADLMPSLKEIVKLVKKSNKR